MSKFLVPLPVEILKIRRSVIFRVTVGIFCFLPLMCGLFMLIIMNPSIAANSVMLKTKADRAAPSADGPAYFGLLEQAGVVGGFLVFGFVFAWIFGREYSDRTVKDLLSLPASRTAIAASKLAAAFLWCMLLVVVAFAVGLGIGALIGLPLWSAGTFAGFARIFILAGLMTVLLCPAVALVANLGKGYLSSIGFVMVMMALAQVAAAAGWGPWFPWAVPALFSGSGGTAASVLPPESWLLLGFVGIAGVAATIIHWNYADQNR
jgi:ABC-2 type transport system permease protein